MPSPDRKQPPRPRPGSFVGLYDAGWSVARPFLKLSKRLARGYARRVVPDNWCPQPVNIWIQAASAGEARLAKELLRCLSPGLSLLMTAITDQGLEELGRIKTWAEANRRDLGIRLAYFPFDAPSLMQKALLQADPDLIVLLETELWPGLLAKARARQTPVMLVNGRMSRKSLRRYLALSKIFKPIRPKEILAVSPDDLTRFALLFGPEQVSLMPNIKLDRLAQELDAPPETSTLTNLFAPQAKLIALGSVREQEEPDILELLKILVAARPDLTLALCPRHMHRKGHWTTTLPGLGRPWTLRSLLSPAKPAEPGSIVLWDVFGELPQVYGLAQAAFVGGSLKPLGGQNFLEALAVGLIPCTGPSWHNFAWVGSDIVSAGLLKVGQNYRQVADLLLEQVQDREPTNQVLARLKTYLQPRLGGTALACQHISQYLK